MEFIVNKETKTIEIHSGIISYNDIKGLVEQFEGFSFLICSPKIERKGLTVGAAYVSVIGDITHS